MLLGAAFVFPAYGTSSASSSGARSSGSQTLVQVNGLGVLIPVGVPLIIAALVWAALHYKCSRGGRVGDRVAWSCVAFLACFCVVAIFSIGMVVLPVALLLAFAALLTPSGSEAPQGVA